MGRWKRQKLLGQANMGKLEGLKGTFGRLHGMGPSWSLLVPLVAAAAVAATVLTVGAVQGWKGRVQRRVAELEAALVTAVQQRAAERTGRIRAQRELRKALLSSKDLKEGNVGAYPMTPIGTVRSCFSTRNGTPRQPMLVSLARATLVLSSKGVPAEAFHGLAQYSHCWLLYVFHENTDLPCLWKQPAHKDFKAKVRVPRLDGGKLGVFATRTPHRPCPIGLTVAKVEGVQGPTLLLSGADLVDGTIWSIHTGGRSLRPQAMYYPVLDVKPYLPYCDAVPEASAPSWVKAGGEDDVIAMTSVSFTGNFSRDIIQCWEVMGKQSLYSSCDEVRALIKQVLSRDIRSLSQRQRPHVGVLSTLHESALSSIVSVKEQVDMSAQMGITSNRVDRPHTQLSDNPPKDAEGNLAQFDKLADRDEGERKTGELEPLQQPSGPDMSQKGGGMPNSNLENVTYHLILEGINVAYTLHSEGRVVVEGAAISQPLKPIASPDYQPGRLQSLFS